MITQANSFRIPMKDNSVHCCISSFPYFGLRSYNLPPIIIGGRADCRHEWGGSKVVKNTPQRDHNGANGFADSRGTESHRAGTIQEFETGQLCQLCGAFYGSFGLEPTIALHVQNAVLVCREIKRVLRPDGIFWLNYGDSYSTARNGRSAADGKAAGNDDRTFRDKPFTVDEIPAKNLCLIPERIVIALQDDGWIVRSVAPWIKRSAMPESVKDRAGTAHEYIFMLTKGPRYYFDMTAVRKPAQDRPFAGNDAKTKRPNDTAWHDNRYAPGASGYGHNPSGRALRTSDFFFDSLDAQIAHLEAVRDKGGVLVNDEGLSPSGDSQGSPAAFVVNPRGYKFAHYATYPLELVSPMIKASTSQYGCCPKCGGQWVRVVEKVKGDNPSYNGSSFNKGKTKDARELLAKVGEQERTAVVTTLGWRPSCSCPGNDETIPAIVFDPFVGSGATLAAANELGRRGIGLDLNPVYLAENALPRAEKKMSQKSLGQLPLFKAA